MTAKEIDHEFDILYNNISSGAAPNLNEYEKSLFLTKAQEELVRVYYNGANARYLSFEADEESRRYLDTLVSEKVNMLTNPSAYGRYKDYIVSKPNDTMFVLRETAANASGGCLDGTVMQVIPVRHEDLNRVLEDPFKAPNTRKCVRFDMGGNDVRFHILSAVPLKSYTAVYLMQPYPIIIADLSVFTDEEGNAEYTIHGLSTPPDDGYDVPDSLMHKIISRAAELAKVAYTGDIGATFAVDARDL